jgi:hypothetical protein
VISRAAARAVARIYGRRGPGVFPGPLCLFGSSGLPTVQAVEEAREAKTSLEARQGEVGATLRRRLHVEPLIEFLGNALEVRKWRN